MENIFVDDRFFSDMESLLEWIEDNEDCTIEELPEDYVIDVNESTKEKLVTFSAEWMVNRIDEERFSEDGDEQSDICKILEDCIDFDKINSKIPELYYPKYKSIKMTKEDLLKCL